MHQCLACGHIIPDEQAVEVLRGCRECKGTRFYYTKAAMTQSERDEVLRKSQADVSQVVAEVLTREAPDAAAEVGDWAELRPKDVRRILKEVQGRRENARQEGADESSAAKDAGRSTPPEAGWEYADATPIGIDTTASKARVTQEVTAREQAPKKPDTVDIGDGSYDIDVKALLERNPIVVHKDGAYLIHLPSLFGKQ